jgi:hypothetical protein
MPALLSWILLLGGVATTITAAVVASEVEFEAAIALGGLLATVVGAVGLLLSRVAGNAPRELRPPGATGRVNQPMARQPWVRPPSGSSRRPRRRSRGPSSGWGVATSTMPQTMPSNALAPPRQATPTAPRSRGAARTPLLVAAFVLGVAWQMTTGSGSNQLLDSVTGLVLLATPVALVVALMTRVIGGRAWGPAVTLVGAGLAVVIGSVIGGMTLALFG